MRNNALTKKGRKWAGATEAAGALTGNKTMEAEGRVERRSVQRTTYWVVPNRREDGSSSLGSSGRLRASTRPRRRR